MGDASPPAGRGPRRPSRWAALPLVAPALILLLALFALPLGRLLALSLSNGGEGYRRIVGDGPYLQVIGTTLTISLEVTVACVLLGYPLAHHLASAPGRWAALGLVMVLVPFWTSLLVRTYAWMVLLGRNGVINRWLLDLGLIERPLPLMFNAAGVLVGMVHVLLPFFVLPLYAVMRRIDPTLVSAAQGLGAPGWQVFRRVYLPLTMPGVLAGSTLVFAMGVGFFITPALLGGGKVVMIGVLLEEQIRTFLDWPFAAALAAVLTALVLAMSLVYQRLFAWDQTWH